MISMSSSDSALLFGITPSGRGRNKAGLGLVKRLVAKHMLRAGDRRFSKSSHWAEVTGWSPPLTRNNTKGGSTETSPASPQMPAKKPCKKTFSTQSVFFSFAEAKSMERRFAPNLSPTANRSALGIALKRPSLGACCHPRVLAMSVSGLRNRLSLSLALQFRSYRKFLAHGAELSPSTLLEHLFGGMCAHRKLVLTPIGRSRS
mmetsp:Transcript_31236/g.62409  ORF Transcript_31236/g.62409 Transcript_31236/m.62409 type:complete len:203 (+) Transcript_31236:843-1451(+)